MIRRNYNRRKGFIFYENITQIIISHIIKNSFSLCAFALDTLQQTDQKHILKRGGLLDTVRDDTLEAKYLPEDVQ